jgi:hypothetical protein
MTLTRRQTLIEAAATAAAAALPAVAMAETVAVDEEYLSFLALCLRDGAAPYGTRWTKMLVYKGRRCMIIASAPDPNVADLCWFDVFQESGIENNGFTPDDIISRAGMRKTERWCMGGPAS